VISVLSDERDKKHNGEEGKREEKKSYPDGMTLIVRWSSTTQKSKKLYGRKKR